MRRLKLVVLGTLASDPYAGMAWMHVQLTEGLRRLGHDVWYLELTSTWPYDPERLSPVNDSNYAGPYLQRVMESFGLGDRWGYRRTYGDGEWLGLSRTEAEGVLAEADLVFNVSGSTSPEDIGSPHGPLVFYGTDPVGREIRYALGEPDTVACIDAHAACVTYGENIGRPDCPLPPLPRLCGHTRQPVLCDLWLNGPPTRHEWTTVGNWKQQGADLEWNGDVYFWSKHHEFLKFVDLPQRVGAPLELATGLSQLDPEDRQLLKDHGWRLVDGQSFTRDPWTYREYVRASRAEFTVAKDQNVRLRSGWFSERSASYLAAGRPVVTQDTGFGCALPTGEGLFAFNTMDEILAAYDAINSDYERHSRAARDLAREFFAAEKVLARLLADLGY